MTVGYKIHVFGKVQGVGFRFQTQQLAKKMGITGYVANQDDGSVLIEAEGDAKQMLNFIDAVKKSPSPFGKVKKTQLDKQDVVGYLNFQTK